MAASDGIELDLTQFDKATRRMIKAGADMRPAFRKARPSFRKDQREHMKAQESSSGGAWPKLAASTKEKRISKGGRAGKFTKRGKLRKPARRKLNRILSGRLNVGAKVAVKQREMTFTSRAKWAGIHQEGGVAGKGSRIPKREFLWVSDPFLRKFVATAGEHLRAAWEKKRL